MFGRKKGNRHGFEPMEVPNPNLFQIEEILHGLEVRDRSNVRLTRIQLKWMIKKAEKEMNIRIENPYRK